MKKGLCMILVTSLVVSSLMIALPVDSGKVATSISALTPHIPIRIDSNADFPGNASSGDGSALTPWVIENFSIDGTGNGSCIYIGNTTEYFVVRNCTLYNANGGDGLYDDGASLNMYNVANGTLHNNTVNSSSFGVRLYNSFNIIIAKNNASYNTNTGILLDASSNGNDVNNNTISHNGLHGIYIYLGTGNHLTDNQAYNNSKYGIYLYSASNNEITNCSVHNNTDTGVYLYLGSNYNNVTRCRMANNAYGVRISAPSNNNSIYHNDFINNTDQGYDNTNTNFWDNGYPSGGNYWSGYSSVDIYSGPGQNISGSDFIGDTPYVIDIDSQDRYPLMKTFNSPTPSDTVPPKAIAWGPLGNSVEVSEKIFILWNESMNWTSVENAFTYTDGVSNWTSANGTWNHDLFFNSTFTPITSLKYQTKYWVKMNCTARDFAGNLLDQDQNGTGGLWPSDVLAWNFTVTDQAPYVISTIPANAQIDVDPNKAIKVVFSEPMNKTSVAIGFSYTNGTHTWNETNGVISWNANQTEFTFSPIVYY